MTNNINIFHSLFKSHNMKVLEWICMLVLDKEYYDIHGRVKIKKIKFSNSESIDLIVKIIKY